MAESGGPFDAYLHALRASDIREKTEHTDRDAVKALLQNFAGPGIKIIHETKRVPGKGAPDFKVRQNGQIVGYVETKPIGTDLGELQRFVKSDQISRYRSLSQNIILTDYLNWIWLRNGHVQSGTLCDLGVVQKTKARLDDARTDQLSAILSGFLSVPPQRIGRAEELAGELAIRTRLLRDFLGDELIRQGKENQGERLYGLYLEFKKQVSETITAPEFADAFAQTLSYGLFLSKLNANGHSLHLGNAKQYVPKSFRLIQELVGFLDELQKDAYKEVSWVVDEILSITNGLDVHSIKEDLSFKNRKIGSRRLKSKDEEEWRLFSRDPFIYFYEDFLAEYDAKLRKARGVYYTPPPVVNFIVRGIDDILKKDFDLNSGLADQNSVTALEFACGTGTFIVEMIEQIIKNVGSSSGKIELVLKEHVLKNLFAFEYLIAPYTIAHLKLSQYLEDRQIRIGDNQRFNIFLTNTLEPLEPQPNLFLPALSEETKNAIAVKNRPILVITGNPPYSGHSKNKGPAITAAIGAYKQVDGRPLGEKNPKWLQDDYVKFFRFAQMKMESVDKGIVGIITNHSWIDNATFRGMRRSLMNTFNQVWVLDLHGNAKKKERTPEGGDDQNVFDIEQGVAITLLVKKRGLAKGVWHADLWGTRLSKYRYLSEQSISDISWNRLDPVAPFYLFVPQNRDVWSEYEAGWPVPAIFPINVLGFQTHRDHFAIAFERADIEQKARAMLDSANSNEYLREKYDLKDNRDWQLSAARTSLTPKSVKANVMQCAYRPFDDRWCYHGYEFMDYPRRELLEHVAQRNNVTLGIGRSGAAIPERPWELVTVSNKPMDANIFRRGGVNLFPLYLYGADDHAKERIADLFQLDNPFRGKERIENLAPTFRNWIIKRYEKRFSPDQIAGYVYAILHAPSYRERFRDFLRMDFPRIPFPKKRSDFEALSALGSDLVKAHLLKAVPSLGLGRYSGKGNHEVETLRYVDADQAIYINETQHFAPVPEQVWNFYIGGFQVLAKYLKDRRGRKLTLSEVENVEQVTNVLAFTLEQMRRIDVAYRAAF